MLELLCRIRYSRLFFVLIAGGSTAWVWHEKYKLDVAEAVNGVVNLDGGFYIFSLILILLTTFAFLAVVNLMFDLDFEYKSDKIQDFFKEKLHTRKLEKVMRDRQELERIYKQQQAEVAEKQELEDFVKYCKKQGGVK